MSGRNGPINNMGRVKHVVVLLFTCVHIAEMWLLVINIIGF